MEYSTLLESSKDVIIIHPFSNQEVATPKFGGTRLIYEQTELLRNKGYNIHLLPLADVGSLTSLFYRFEGRMRGKSRVASTIKTSEDRRWLFNMVARIAEDTLSVLDFPYVLKLRARVQSIADTPLVIYHYPYGFRALNRAMGGSASRKIVYEHNVEWQFLESNVKQSVLARVLISMCKKIELANLRIADHVLFLSRKDEKVVQDYGIHHEKTSVWIPISRPSRKNDVSSLPDDLLTRFRKHFVVGFVGTNFAPNVRAVENICRIADELADTKVLFLVLGNVSEAFKVHSLPENVYMAGYVPELSQYLSHCKAFINPKSTSETGVEIKMFDYLSYDKPIITTSFGAHGFDNLDNVTIAELSAIPGILKQMSVDTDK